MRGKGLIKPNTTETTRITPAHAGKSKEKLFADENGKGSPPHMRGKAMVKQKKALN